MFLPPKLLEYFEITDAKEQLDVKHDRMGLYIYLQERLLVPLGHSATDLESKGFDPPVTVQDFPVRGKPLFLVISKRRWRVKAEGFKTVTNDYGFVTEGIKLTQELSDFLKGIGRDPSTMY
jgi:hypothetical protein